IYNTTNFIKTGHVTISGMNYPRSLVSCSHYNCIYVSGEGGYIHRVQLPDQHVTKWEVSGNATVSVTRAHNLLVTFFFPKKESLLRVLREYTTYGVPLREIR